MTSPGPGPRAHISRDEAFERAAGAFADLAGGAAADARLFVPGRLEVLGKHTDYAGGRSLTCAVDRGFAVLFRRRDAGTFRIVDARDGRRAECPISPDLEPTVGHWSNYPVTVVRRLRRNFPTLAAGADLAFFSTLPKAAGLSTSSALMTAVFLALVRVNDLEQTPEFRRHLGEPGLVAGYLGSIENGQSFGALAGDYGVGTTGGSEDQTAILMGEAGRLGLYRYHPVTRLASLPLDPSLTFVVAASGIAADKTGTARERYNRAAALVAGLLERWRAATGREDATLAEALDAGPDAVARLRAIASGELLTRLEHFLLEEREILPAAVDALARGDLAAFGPLVDASQLAADTLLGNQVPETVTLAGLARELGAHAASAFGAGFGGSVWALVDVTDADVFRRAWAAAYAARHPDASSRAEFFVTRPAPGALTT